MNLPKSTLGFLLYMIVPIIIFIICTGTAIFAIIPTNLIMRIAITFLIYFAGFLSFIAYHSVYTVIGGEGIKE